MSFPSARRHKNALYRLLDQGFPDIRDILGTVVIVNDHGIMVDHDKTNYTMTHMDPDGKVVETRSYPSLNDAVTAAAMLKRALERTTIFVPDKRFLQ